MHACIVCGKTIPEETIIRICGKAETKIDGKAQTIGNVICDECLDNGWMYCMDEHSEIHIVQIAPSTEPDKIFTVRELMLEGETKDAVDKLL